MNAIVEIDKAGRIVIPKKMRDALGLRPGTRLRLDQSGERLTLDQAADNLPVETHDGFPVMVGGIADEPDLAAMIREGYRDREARMTRGSGLE